MMNQWIRFQSFIIIIIYNVVIHIHKFIPIPDS